MSYRVLISAPYFIPVIDQFRELLESAGLELEVASVSERLSEEELLRYAGQIDGSISGDDWFSARVLQAAAPRLKVISKWGTGIDSIDQAVAQELGIKVFSTPGAFTDPVADSVLGYVLAFARRIPWTARQMQLGGWEKTLGQTLAESTLGVVGVGNIGKAVIRRAGGFGIRLLGNDIKPIDGKFLEDFNLTMMTLPELLEQADYLSLNCDLNPTSFHLIGRPEFSAMKSGAILINTARGAVVDQPALVKALQSGRLAGAALDVFEDEPLPANHPLRSMEHVLLAPHNANSSPKAWQRVHLSTVANLLKGLGLDVPQRLPGSGV
jgi:D-3-phosphoglycerate dehydrogenase